MTWRNLILVTLKASRDKRYIYRYYMTSLWPASKGEEGGEKRDRGYEKEGKLPPPQPHSPSIFAPADHAKYNHHTFLVWWFKLCQEPVIGYWFLFIIDLLCYIKTMVISDTLFCHRIALTNASAWSLNKFYIIQCNVALRIISTSTLKYKLQQNTSKWKVYSKRAILRKEAWENSRHFAKLPLVSPRNDVWETNAEIAYWWRVTTQI